MTVARKLSAASKMAKMQMLNMQVAKAQKIALSLGLALALNIPLSSLAALASAVEMKQPQGKSVQASLALPVASIGSMLLPDGQISVNGQLVEVGAVPEWLFDRHTVLTGTLIRLDLGAGATSANTNSRLDGLVYFTGGDWLKNLRRSRISETVEAADGNTYVGRISTVTSDSLSIDTLPGQSRTLALANVKNIVSPYCYRFSAPASDVKLSPEDGSTICDASTATFALSQPLASLSQSAQSPMTLQPGQTSGQPKQRMFSGPSPVALKLPKSTLAGTEGGITKKAIIAMVAVDAANTLAPIIALPLTMTIGQGRAENTLNGYTNANLINDFILKMPLVTPPTAKF